MQPMSMSILVFFKIYKYLIDVYILPICVNMIPPPVCVYMRIYRVYMVLGIYKHYYMRIFIHAYL